MKTLLSFLALSLCAAAQTTSNVPGVALNGPAGDPTLENHSGKTVISALLISMPADGKPWVSKVQFIHDSLGVPDGKSETFGFARTHRKIESPIVSAKIGAVIFADGEFRGEDNYQAGASVIPAYFQSGQEKRFEAMRRLLQMAKAGNWAAVKTEADGNGDGKLYAGRLIFERDHGTIDKVAHWALLPQATWKGSRLINELRRFVPDSLAAWFMPAIVYAQSVSYNFVTNWPQSDQTDAWHPTKYSYGCRDFNNSTYPCPGQLNDTPEEGIAAVCNASPTYDIGDSETLSQDYGGSVGLVMTINGGEVQPGGPTWTLKNWGVCQVPILGFYEQYEYDKSCTGASDPHPVLNYDNTGSNVCGTSPLGYHS